MWKAKIGILGLSFLWVQIDQKIDCGNKKQGEITYKFKHSTDRETIIYHQQKTGAHSTKIFANISCEKHFPRAMSIKLSEDYFPYSKAASRNGANVIHQNAAVKLQSQIQASPILNTLNPFCSNSNNLTNNSSGLSPTMKCTQQQVVTGRKIASNSICLTINNTASKMIPLQKFHIALAARSCRNKAETETSLFTNRNLLLGDSESITSRDFKCETARPSTQKEDNKFFSSVKRQKQLQQSKQFYLKSDHFKGDTNRQDQKKGEGKLQRQQDESKSQSQLNVGDSIGANNNQIKKELIKQETQCHETVNNNLGPTTTSTKSGEVTSSKRERCAISRPKAAKSVLITSNEQDQEPVVQQKQLKKTHRKSASQSAMHTIKDISLSNTFSPSLMNSNHTSTNINGGSLSSTLQMPTSNTSTKAQKKKNKRELLVIDCHLPIHHGSKTVVTSPLNQTDRLQQALHSAIDMNSKSKPTSPHRNMSKLKSKSIHSLISNVIEENRKAEQKHHYNRIEGKHHFDKVDQLQSQQHQSATFSHINSSSAFYLKQPISPSGSSCMSMRLSKKNYSSSIRSPKQNGSSNNKQSKKRMLNYTINNTIASTNNVVTNNSNGRGSNSNRQFMKKTSEILSLINQNALKIRRELSEKRKNEEEFKVKKKEEKEQMKEQNTNIRKKNFIKFTNKKSNNISSPKSNANPSSTMFNRFIPWGIDQSKFHKILYKSLGLANKDSQNKTNNSTNQELIKKQDPKQRRINLGLGRLNDMDEQEIQTIISNQKSHANDSNQNKSNNRTFSPEEKKAIQDFIEHKKRQIDEEEDAKKREKKVKEDRLRLNLELLKHEIKEQITSCKSTSNKNTNQYSNRSPSHTSSAKKKLVKHVKSLTFNQKQLSSPRHFAKISLSNQQQDQVCEYIYEEYKRQFDWRGAFSESAFYSFPQQQLLQNQQQSVEEQIDQTASGSVNISKRSKQQQHKKSLSQENLLNLEDWNDQSKQDLLHLDSNTKYQFHNIASSGSTRVNQQMNMISKSQHNSIGLLQQYQQLGQSSNNYSNNPNYVSANNREGINGITIPTFEERKHLILMQFNKLTDKLSKQIQSTNNNSNSNNLINSTNSNLKFIPYNESHSNNNMHNSSNNNQSHSYRNIDEPSSNKQQQQPEKEVSNLHLNPQSNIQQLIKKNSHQSNTSQPQQLQQLSQQSAPIEHQFRNQLLEQAGKKKLSQPDSASSGYELSKSNKDISSDAIIENPSAFNNDSHKEQQEKQSNQSSNKEILRPIDNQQKFSQKTDTNNNNTSVNNNKEQKINNTQSDRPPLQDNIPTPYYSSSNKSIPQQQREDTQNDMNAFDLYRQTEEEEISSTGNNNFNNNNNSQTKFSQQSQENFFRSPRSDKQNDKLNKQPFFSSETINQINSEQQQQDKFIDQIPTIQSGVSQDGRLLRLPNQKEEQEQEIDKEEMQYSNFQEDEEVEDEQQQQRDDEYLTEEDFVILHIAAIFIQKIWRGYMTRKLIQQYFLSQEFKYSNFHNSSSNPSSPSSKSNQDNLNLQNQNQIQGKSNNKEESDSNKLLQGQQQQQEVVEEYQLQRKTQNSQENSQRQIKQGNSIYETISNNGSQNSSEDKINPLLLGKKSSSEKLIEAKQNQNSNNKFPQNNQNNVNNNNCNGNGNGINLTKKFSQEHKEEEIQQIIENDRDDGEDGEDHQIEGIEEVERVVEQVMSVAQEYQESYIKMREDQVNKWDEIIKKLKSASHGVDAELIQQLCKESEDNKKQLLQVDKKLERAQQVLKSQKTIETNSNERILSEDIHYPHHSPKRQKNYWNNNNNNCKSNDISPTKQLNYNINTNQNTPSSKSLQNSSPLSSPHSPTKKIQSGLPLLNSSPHSPQKKNNAIKSKEKLTEKTEEEQMPSLSKQNSTQNVSEQDQQKQLLQTPFAPSSHQNQEQVMLSLPQQVLQGLPPQLLQGLQGFSQAAIQQITPKLIQGFPNYCKEEIVPSDNNNNNPNEEYNYNGQLGPKRGERVPDIKRKRQPIPQAQQDNILEQPTAVNVQEAQVLKADISKLQSMISAPANERTEQQVKKDSMYFQGLSNSVDLSQSKQHQKRSHSQSQQQKSESPLHFKDFTPEAYNKMMLKKESMEDLMKMGQDVLQFQKQAKIKIIKKMLEQHKVDPLTYDAKKKDIEQWEARERDKLKKAHHEIERGWRKFAETVQQTKRGIDFMKQIKKFESKIPSEDFKKSLWQSRLDSEISEGDSWPGDNNSHSNHNNNNNINKKGENSSLSLQNFPSNPNRNLFASPRSIKIVDEYQTHCDILLKQFSKKAQNPSKSCASWEGQILHTNNSEDADYEDINDYLFKMKKLASRHLPPQIEDDSLNTPNATLQKEIVPYNIQEHLKPNHQIQQQQLPQLFQGNQDQSSVIQHLSTPKISIEAVLNQTQKGESPLSTKIEMPLILKASSPKNDQKVAIVVDNNSYKEDKLQQQQYLLQQQEEQDQEEEEDDDDKLVPFGQGSHQQQEIFQEGYLEGEPSHLQNQSLSEELKVKDKTSSANSLDLDDKNKDNEVGQANSDMMVLPIESQEDKMSPIDCCQNLNSIKDFLVALAEFIKENFRDEFLQRVNQPLGIESSEFLKTFSITENTEPQDTEASNGPIYPIVKYLHVQKPVVSEEIFLTFNELYQRMIRRQRRVESRIEGQYEIGFEEQEDDEDDDIDIFNSQSDIEKYNLKLIFDCFNESLDFLRPFSLGGKPLPWKLNQKKLAAVKVRDEDVERVLGMAIGRMLKWGSCLCGFISEKIEFPQGQEEENKEYLNQIKEDRLAQMLENEVLENEQKWLIYEEEETDVQLEVSDDIFHFLVNEAAQWLCLKMEGKLDEMNLYQLNVGRQNTLKNFEEMVEDEEDQKQLLDYQIENTTAPQEVIKIKKGPISIQQKNSPKQDFIAITHSIGNGTKHMLNNNENSQGSESEENIEIKNNHRREKRSIARGILDYRINQNGEVDGCDLDRTPTEEDQENHDNFNIMISEHDYILEQQHRIQQQQQEEQDPFSNKQQNEKRKKAQMQEILSKQNDKFLPFAKQQQLLQQAVELQQSPQHLQDKYAHIFSTSKGQASSQNSSF